MFRILKDATDLQLVIDNLHKHGPLAYKVLGHARQALTSNAGDEIVVDDWPNFQVVLARPTCKSQPYTNNCYSIFAIDSDKVKAFLTQDGVVPWKQKLVFTGINAELGDTLQEAASEMGCKLDPEDVGGKYYILEMKEISEASELTDVPSGYTLGKLEPSDAKLIADVWKFGSDGCEEYVRYLIENQQTSCVRFSGSSTESTDLEAAEKPHKIAIAGATADTPMSIPEQDTEGVRETHDELVAWYLEQPYGALGMLHVMEPHRRKGLAKAVEHHLAAYIKAQGRPVFVYLEVDNEVSLQLHEKCGFQLIDGVRVQWIRCAPSCGARAKSSSCKCCV